MLPILAFLPGGRKKIRSSTSASLWLCVSFESVMIATFPTGPGPPLVVHDLDARVTGELLKIPARRRPARRQPRRKDVRDGDPDPAVGVRFGHLHPPAPADGRLGGGRREARRLASDREREAE